MSTFEFTLCLSAVLSSSVSQLCIKGASNSARRRLAIGLLCAGVALLCGSVVLAVLALRNLPLSQLVSFAAFAYVLVPLGACLVFHEALTRRFWLGALCIVGGIVWMHA